MQTAYDKFEMRVHKGHGSLLVTIPYLLCEREKIKVGDVVVFNRPEGRKRYRFYKNGSRKTTVASQGDEDGQRVSG